MIARERAMTRAGAVDVAFTVTDLITILVTAGMIGLQLHDVLA
jgi:hypothetical protein